MVPWVRSSIVIRTTLMVLCVTLLVGFLADYIAYRVAEKRAISAQKEVVETLLDVVEQSASAACFVGDKTLAEQVVQGLVKTKSIMFARLEAGTENLAKAERLEQVREGIKMVEIERRLYSPFAPDRQIGKISLTQDPQETRRQVDRTVTLVRMVVIFLTLALGSMLAFTVHHSVTRPIRTLSGRLHLLEATAGARLFYPHGHEGDEIGQLVNDVNSLVERLVDVLWAERDLREQLEIDRKKVQSILEHAGTGIFVVRRDGTLDAWTPAFLRLLDLENAPPPKGASFPVLFGLNAGQAEAWMNACLDEGRRVVETFQLRDFGGDRQRWLQITLDPLATDWIQGLLDDVTVHKQATEAAEELAVRDVLTGALNRLGTERLLAERLPTAVRGLGLMLVDLDRFKQVNDSYGHDAGDEVLRQSTARIRQVLRRSDVVARLGGDEFLLIVDYLENENIAMGIAQKVISAVNAPIKIKGDIEVGVGASIGITLYHAHEQLQWEVVLKRADRAMYLAKQAGRNCAKLVKE